MLGIDPGKSGGFAIVGDDVLRAEPMPKTEGDTLELLSDLGVFPRMAVAIEKVAPNGQNGSQGNFRLGESFGFLRGVVWAFYVRRHKVPLIDITPRKWQDTFGLYGKHKDRVSKKTGKPYRVKDKNAHKAVAQQLFPALKITHAVADALLIAEHARRLVNPPE